MEGISIFSSRNSKSQNSHPCPAVTRNLPSPWVSMKAVALAVPPGGSQEAVTLGLPGEMVSPYLLAKNNLNNNSFLIRNKVGYKEATTFFLSAEGKEL